MKILVPTDFSINAHKAFQYAAEVYSWAEPEIILVNVQNARHAGSVITMDLNQDLMIEGRKAMEKELEYSKKEYSKLNIRGIVTAGTFEDSILEMINENNVDLVIAGTKGATGAKEILMGSNASALVENIMKPLIVVPEQWTVKIPKQVMLASDFIENPNQYSYDPLLDLCYEIKPKLDIFHVRFAGSEPYTIDKIPFSVEGLDFELSEFMSSDVEGAILDHAHKSSTDLIAMVKSKGGFIYNLFHQSVSKKVSMHTDVAVMILR